MSLRVPLRRRLFSGLAEQNSILPECFNVITKPFIDIPASEAKEKTEVMKEPPIVQQSSTNFHHRVAGGFNGLLAKIYEYNRAPEDAVKYHAKMKELAIPMTNRLTYNYMISAYLRLRMFEEAFRLVLELESCGLGPDRMTFDVFLEELSQMRGMEVAVDELFLMMRERLGPDTKPDEKAWAYRILAWTVRKKEEHAIKRFKECLANQVILSPASNVLLLRKAALSGCSLVLAEIIRHFKESNARLPLEELQTMLDYESLYKEEENLPAVKYFIDQLKSLLLDEGTYERVLLFAYRTKSATLAEVVMDKICHIYKSDAQAKLEKKLRIPKEYIKTYLEIMEMTPIDQLTSTMTKRIQVFKK